MVRGRMWMRNGDKGGGKEGGGGSSSKMSVSETSELTDYDLEQLVTLFRSKVDIRDRKHRLKTYRSCFVGNEAVDALVNTGVVSNREDATELGQMMLDAGVFHHVLREHGFKDDMLFYEFTSGHGEVQQGKDGFKTTWGSLIKPVTLHDVSSPLQPQMAQYSENGQIDFDIIQQLNPLDKWNLKLLDQVHPPAWKDPSPPHKYHMVVIGAGSGGLVTAAGAAGVGAKVALIEKNLLGGDCLNYGCVPSKALISAAKAYWNVKNAAGLDEFGISITGASVDFGKVMERLRRLRAEIAENDAAERFAKKLGVDVYIGTASFVDKNTVTVNGKKLTFAKCTIATGGSPRLPDIDGIDGLFYASHKQEPGAPTIVTNESIFNLTKLPPRFAVIGNGAIGLEIAQCMTRFGSEVSVFGRGGRIMGKEDRDAADILQKRMTEEGTVFHLDVDSYVSLKKTGRDVGGFQEMEMKVTTKQGTRTHVFDALLVAAGRTPNVKGLELAKAGVKFSRKEGVAINDKLQTSQPNIFAVGDCCSKYKFTHVADFMARIAIRNALFLGKDKFSSLIIPWATYTEPEVAHVGLYERDAKGECVTFEKAFSTNDRAILEGETDGFVRVHVQKGSDKILGATIVGANAGNMISELTLAMNAEFGLGSIASVIHPYPTEAEVVRGVGDLYNKTRLTPTVRAILRQVLKLS